jgi:hypothetical protein
MPGQRLGWKTRADQNALMKKQTFLGRRLWPDDMEPEGVLQVLGAVTETVTSETTNRTSSPFDRYAHVERAPRRHQDVRLSWKDPALAVRHEWP